MHALAPGRCANCGNQFSNSRIRFNRRTYCSQSCILQATNGKCPPQADGRYKVDANQQEIVMAVEAIGASVEILSDIGSGCPDLLVGYCGRNYMLEVKGSANGLSLPQQNWHSRWQGHVAIVRTAQDAIHILLGDADTMKAG